MKKLSIEEIGKIILEQLSLGHCIDKTIQPQDIEDIELRELWMETQTSMNEIQLYLEDRLPVGFFQ